MYILGVSGGFRPGNMDGAACLVYKDKIIAAAEEERFSRTKHAPGQMPLNAIRFCLREAGISIHDVNTIVFAGASYKDIKIKLKNYFNFKFGYCPPLALVEHHLAHAASTYLLSGFKNAGILTMDLSGDGISTLLALGKGGKIIKLKGFKRPNSLGAYYNIITQYLGFNRNNDEYKVMGLAAYGRPLFDFSWLLKKSPDGYIFDKNNVVKLTKKNPFPSVQEPLYNRNFLKHLAPLRLPDSAITQYHKDIAASAQKHLEEIICHLAEVLFKQTGTRDLCIAGGVGLNCVANARLRNLPFVDNIFIPPICSDAGLAIGCAVKVASEKGFKFNRLRHAYFGPGYTNSQIEEVLRRLKCRYRRCDNIACFVAGKLARGKIIGWFQGRMEYGPRALGARSILADPRSKNMKDKLNRLIKFREPFRPFAPSVLNEYAHDYFKDAIEAPFMTLNFEVREEKKNKIPAVVHIDGTSRVQTVSKEANPRYYEMIKQFHKITCIPLVLNTSFNINEEPIVCSPSQAVATFHETGLDYLAIGDFIIRKR